MTTFPALTATLAVLALAATVPTQTFYLGTEADHERMTAIEGSTPATLVGALIGEDDTTYTLRVEGGEVTLPKDSVWKVEGSAPTLASIEESEAKARDDLAIAENQRQEFLARDREFVRNLRADAAEASYRAEPELVLPEAEVAPEFVPLPAYDPVLGVAPTYASSLAFEYELLYQRTNDTQYRRLMRQARRMR